MCHAQSGRTQHVSGCVYVQLCRDMAETRALHALYDGEGKCCPAFVTFGSGRSLVVGLVHRRVGRAGLPAALVIVASVRLWLALAPNVTLLFSLVSAGLFCDIVYKRC